MSIHNASGITEARSALIRRSDLPARLGVSDTTVWRLERSGVLPARVQISQRAVGYRESDIAAWLEARSGGHR